MSEYLVITVPAGLAAGAVKVSSDKVIVRVEPLPKAIHRPIKSNRPDAK